jgi:hypothetical protein
MPKPRREKKRPGPTPARVVIEGDWRDAILRALKKKRPKGGWPEPDVQKDNKRKSD